MDEARIDAIITELQADKWGFLKLALELSKRQTKLQSTDQKEIERQFGLDEDEKRRIKSSGTDVDTALRACPQSDPIFQLITALVDTNLIRIMDKESYTAHLADGVVGWHDDRYVIWADR